MYGLIIFIFETQMCFFSLFDQSINYALEANAKEEDGFGGSGDRSFLMPVKTLYNINFLAWN